MTARGERGEPGCVSVLLFLWVVLLEGGRALGLAALGFQERVHCVICPGCGGYPPTVPGMKLCPCVDGYVYAGTRHRWTAWGLWWRPPISELQRQREWKKGKIRYPSGAPLQRK